MSSTVLDHDRTIYQTLTLVLPTGTPVLRAAFASPPTAKIQFPNVVRLSIQAPRTVTAMNHSTAV